MDEWAGSREGHKESAIAQCEGSVSECDVLRWCQWLLPFRRVRAMVRQGSIWDAIPLSVIIDTAWPLITKRSLASRINHRLTTTLIVLQQFSRRYIKAATNGVRHFKYRPTRTTLRNTTGRFIRVNTGEIIVNGRRTCASSVPSCTMSAALSDKKESYQETFVQSRKQPCTCWTALKHVFARGRHGSWIG